MRTGSGLGKLGLGGHFIYSSTTGQDETNDALRVALLARHRESVCGGHHER